MEGTHIKACLICLEYVFTPSAQGAVILGMVGVSYAAVPLYRMFCQATGYGGTLRPAAQIEDKIRRRDESPNPDLEARAAAREIRVWFTADVADDMPWKFTPTQDFVKVRPGESTLIFYKAHNKRYLQCVTHYVVAHDFL